MPTISVKTILLLVLCLSIAVFGQADSSDPRTGHTDFINAAAFSPDGKFLATASRDQTIIVWDVAEIKEVFKIVWAETAVEAVAYSPDGQVIAGGGTGGVKFWDAKTGKETAALKIEYETVDSIAFSPDGKLLAAGSKESVSLWNVAARRKIRTLEKTKSPVVFHPKGNLLATASGDDLIKIWNVKTGVKMRTIEGAGGVRTLAFNSLGDVLAGVSHDDVVEGKVRFWRTLTGTSVKTATEIKTSGLFNFTPDGKSVLVGAPSYLIPSSGSELPEAIQILSSSTGQERESFGGDVKFAIKGFFSPNGKLFACFSDSAKSIKIFDFQTKEEYAVIEGHSIGVTALAFSSDDQTLLAGYEDGNLIHWNPLAGKIEKAVTADKEYYDDPALTMDSVIGWNVSISEEGDIFSVGGIGGAAIFDAGTGDLLSVRNLPNGNTVFAPRSELIAVFFASKTVGFYLSDGRVFSEFNFQLPENIYDVNLAFSSNRKILAVGTQAGITFWDIEEKKEIKTFKNKFQTLPIFKFSPDDKFLVVADAVARTVKILDISSQTIVRTFEDQGVSFTLSRNGKILAASKWDGIVLSELETGKTLRTIKTGEYDLARIMRFNSDASLLAVGGNRGIAIYKTATGEKIRSMK